MVEKAKDDCERGWDDSGPCLKNQNHPYYCLEDPYSSKGAPAQEKPVLPGGQKKRDKENLSFCCLLYNNSTVLAICQPPPVSTIYCCFSNNHPLFHNQTKILLIKNLICVQS